MNWKRFVRLRAGEVDAAVSTSDISRQFYGEWASGDRYWWWLCAILVDPTDLIVEDDDGKLWRLPYTVGDRDVTFGELTEVYIEYVDAIARREQNTVALRAITDTRGDQRVAAVFNERPSLRPKTKEGDDVREYIEKLRAKYKLPASASDEDVLKAASEAPDPDQAPAPPAPGEPAADDPDPDADPDPDDPDPDPAPDQPQALRVDGAALKKLQEDAALGRQAGELMLKNEREAGVDDAITKGKVPAMARASYLSQWEHDQKIGASVTKDYLAGLTENIIPVEQRAVTPQDQGERDGTQIDANAINGFLAQHMPDVAARKAAALSGDRPRVSNDHI